MPKTARDREAQLRAGILGSVSAFPNSAGRYPLVVSPLNGGADAVAATARLFYGIAG